MDDICRIVFGVYCSQSVYISDIYLGEVIVCSISRSEIYLLDIARIGEYIDIDECYLGECEYIFREKIGADESSSSSDDNCFFGNN